MESNGVTMHGTIGRMAEETHDAIFFADQSDAAGKPIAAVASQRSAYGQMRRPHWPAILLIAGVHAALLIGLVKFDIIAIKKKDPPLTIIDIAEAAPPPAEKPPAPKPEPVEIVPQIVSPPPIVTTNIVTPPPITTAPPPQKPSPTVVAAPPSAPTAVDNLVERRIEGDPPRYPFESRKKKEQGTVVLRVLIGTDGRIAQIAIAQSSSFDRLDQAAFQAVTRWRWQPWMRNGEAIEVRGTVSFPFVLN